MFPSATTRLLAAARRGLDVAVEFATLGEYGVAEAAHRLPAHDGAARGRRPEPSAAGDAIGAATEVSVEAIVG